MIRIVLSLMVLLSAITSQLNAKRDSIVIVGSSTVYPFTTEVVDRFVQKTNSKAPIVRSTGTGGGFKLFCSGVGFEHPDFNNASRPIKESEVATCAKNGIKNIVEIKLGYDTLALIVNKNINLSLTDTEIFLALAAQVPDSNGKLIANPYKKWKDINPELPDLEISFMGPSPTSGTRDSFIEMVMEKGAKKHSAIAKLEGNEIKRLAHSLRKDGVWADVGENDNLLLRKIQNSKNVIGIIGFNYYSENKNNLSAISINGKSIEDSSYSLKRPLFIYAKGEHMSVVKDMSAFIKEMTSSSAISANGYLVRKGLTPLSKEEFAEINNKVKNIGK